MLVAVAETKHPWIIESIIFVGTLVLQLLGEEPLHRTSGRKEGARRLQRCRQGLRVFAQQKLGYKGRRALIELGRCFCPGFDRNMTTVFDSPEVLEGREDGGPFVGDNLC